MTTTLFIVRQNNYWGAGESLSEAKANYKKSSGRAATNLADISCFEGNDEELERVTIDDIDGTIKYPKTVIKK